MKELPQLGLSQGKPQRYSVNADTVSQRLGDDVVIVHLQTNLIYSLNCTAARLWELVNDGHDVLQIEQHLLREFEVDGTQLRNEVAALLSSLLAHQLIATTGTE